METGQAENFFNSAVPSRRLFDHCSLNIAVAHSVQQHFQERFSTPDDGDALEHYLHGLPDSECLCS